MTTRALAVAVLAIVVAVVVLVVRGGRDGTHELRAAFTSAVNVVPGQEVRLHGVQVGKIAAVERSGGVALLRLRVDDPRAWPLHAGTRATLRFGTTVSYAARYVELHPGPASAPTLPSNGLLTTADTETPVEFDDVFRVFRGRTRGDLGALVDRGASTLAGRERELAAGVRDAGPGLLEATELLHQLGDDPYALRTLARSGAATTQALAARAAAVERLVAGAAATFDETAARSRAIGQALRRGPGTLRTAHATLTRLDPTLDAADALLDDVAPGARELRRLAPPLRRTVARLDVVAPDLRAAFAATSRAAPDVRALLREASPFLDRLTSAAHRLEPQVACIRPYAPEIAGFFGTWAGFTKNHDGENHYWRTLLQVPPSSDVELRDAASFVAQTPGQRFALVRPPGLNADAPWFQPQCGAAHDVLDPRKDPESGRRQP